MSKPSARCPALALTLLASTVLVGATGCGAADPAETLGDESALTERPVGTFVLPTDAPLSNDDYVRRIVLRTDGSVLRDEVEVRCFSGGTCQEYPREFVGTYKFSGSSGATQYIRFFDEGGEFVDRFAYTLQGDALSLDCWGHPTLLLHAAPEAAYCEAANECAVQGLSEIDCETGWLCGFDQNCIACVTSEFIDSAKRAYEAAGSDSLPSVTRAKLPPYAQLRYDDNRALWDGSGTQKAYRMTVEGESVFLLEVVTDFQARYFDLFDDGGQYLAAGDEQWGDYQWQ